MGFCLQSDKIHFIVLISYGLPLPLRLKEKGLINFGVVYCREDANESRFENQRGKIWQYFECYCNYLKVRLIARRVAVLRAKEDC